jgi:hypothetical protein
MAKVKNSEESKPSELNYIALSRFRTKDYSRIFEKDEQVLGLDSEELESLVERQIIKAK